MLLLLVSKARVALLGVVEEEGGVWVRVAVMDVVLVVVLRVVEELVALLEVVEEEDGVWVRVAVIDVVLVVVRRVVEELVALLEVAEEEDGVWVRVAVIDVVLVVVRRVLAAVSTVGLRTKLPTVASHWAVSPNTINVEPMQARLPAAPSSHENNVLITLTTAMQLSVPCPSRPSGSVR